MPTHSSNVSNVGIVHLNADLGDIMAMLLNLAQMFLVNQSQIFLGKIIGQYDKVEVPPLTQKL